MSLYKSCQALLRSKSDSHNQGLNQKLKKLSADFRIIKKLYKPVVKTTIAKAITQTELEFEVEPAKEPEPAVVTEPQPEPQPQPEPEPDLEEEESEQTILDKWRNWLNGFVKTVTE